MSVNDVPVWSVTMVPRLMGVPVAFTPGLVPQSDVLTAPVPAEPPLDVLVGLPLLAQPTRVAIPAAAMRATKGRACATRPYIRSCLSTSCGDGKIPAVLGKVCRC